MQANAISFKPRLCFDQLDSPRIGAGQEIFQKKRGVCFNRFAWHERSPQKSRIRKKSFIIRPDSRSEPPSLEHEIFRAVSEDNSRSIKAQTVPRSAGLAHNHCQTGTVPGKIGGLSDSTSRRVDASPPGVSRDTTLF